MQTTLSCSKWQAWTTWESKWTFLYLVSWVDISHCTSYNGRDYVQSGSNLLSKQTSKFTPLQSRRRATVGFSSPQARMHIIVKGRLLEIMEAKGVFGTRTDRCVAPTNHSMRHLLFSLWDAGPKKVLLHSHEASDSEPVQWSAFQLQI